MLWCTAQLILQDKDTQSPSTVKSIAWWQLAMECLPRNFPQLKRAASSKFMSFPPECPHPMTQELEHMKAQLHCLMSGQPWRAIPLPELSLGFLKPLSQLHQSPTSPSLVLLPLLPLQYYKEHSPTSFLQTDLHLKSISWGTQPKIFFHGSPLVILPCTWKLTFLFESYLCPLPQCYFQRISLHYSM